MNKNEKNNIDLLLFCFGNNKQIYTTNCPLSKLIFNFDNIKTILEKENKLNIIKLFFLARQSIHRILFEKEEIINIKYDSTKESLDSNFYLNLLLKENPDIIDYTYSIDYIKEVNKERKKLTDNFKIIVMDKCILDLINNYEQSEEYNEYEDKDILEVIKEENKMAIKQNLEVFKFIGLNYDENDIERRKIDEIYIDIINSLIKKRKFDDYEYTSDVLNQLELKNIDITEKMSEELFKVLNSKEKYVDDYLILKNEDLYDEKKVNFYYILLNFILKDSLHFYQIPFFLETKKIILEYLKIINFNKIINLKKNKNFIEKFEYIIKIDFFFII